jgi:hypothetical protein
MSENKEPVKDTLGILDDGKIDVQDAKRLIESKTFWVNALAFLAFGIQSKFGYVIDESVQAQILTAINVVLRMITKDPVVWSKK